MLEVIAKIGTIKYYHAVTDASSSDIVSAFAFESAQQPTTTSTPHSGIASTNEPFLLFSIWSHR